MTVNSMETEAKKLLPRVIAERDELARPCGARQQPKRRAMMTTRQDELRKMVAAATPGPWRVRKNDRGGEMRDCFVAANDVNGFAYDAEILGDDEYHQGGLVRKLADCDLIAQAPTIALALADALDLLAKRDAELARLASDKSGLQVQVGRLLAQIDDDFAATNGPDASTMHSNGQTPDWYVEAAFWACYGYAPTDQRAAITPSKESRHETNNF